MKKGDSRKLIVVSNKDIEDSVNSLTNDICIDIISKIVSKHYKSYVSMLMDLIRHSNIINNIEESYKDEFDIYILNGTLQNYNISNLYYLDISNYINKITDINMSSQFTLVFIDELYLLVKNLCEKDDYDTLEELIKCLDYVVTELIENICLEYDNKRENMSNILYLNIENKNDKVLITII